MEKEIKELVDKLYFDLPFWKRYKTKRAFLTNGWDYTHEYKKCVEIARKMVETKESMLVNLLEMSKDKERS